MPTRRGPGRPRNPWRPRKLEEDYIAVSEGHHSPATRAAVLRTLRKYGDFLRERGVDSEAVTIHDLIAWEDRLVAKGYTRSANLYNRHVRAYYLLLGSREPDSKWSRLAAELQAHKLPHVIGKQHPHEPYPLDLLPKILKAARHVVQKDQHGNELYSEAYAVVATFLYSGGRAQFYGLRDSEVREALQKKYVRTFVKEGEEVFVPIHDQLLAIWREHLERRDFGGPQFFRNGRYPYSYQDGSKDFMEDYRAANTNQNNVERLLRGLRAAEGVEGVLRRMYGVREHLTAHRFRKSVGSFMDAYGFTEAEQRLQLSHAAKTITQHYSIANALESQKKLSLIDLGNAEWVAAHNPPTNLFANGNGGARDQDEDVLAELRSLREELRAKDRRIEELTNRLLGGAAPAPIVRVVPPDPPEAGAAAVRPKVVA